MTLVIPVAVAGGISRCDQPDWRSLLPCSSVSILKQYPGRANTVHLKPYSLKAGKDDPHLGYRLLIGEDDVPWKDVLKLCEQGGTEWYIVEYESDAFPPLIAVEKCLEGLKKVQASLWG